MDGLFSAAEGRSRVRRELPSLHPNCGRCGLDRGGCHAPKLKPRGGGQDGILLVGDYPTREDDEAGAAFHSSAWAYLMGRLRAHGADPHRATATYAQICRAVTGESKTAVEDCRPNVLRLIRERKPSVILTLGQAALSSVVGHAWKPDVGPLDRWTGRVIPCQNPNAWVIPCDSPAFILRQGTCRTVRDQFELSLKAACDLAGSPPWPAGPPDYAAQVRLIESPDEGASWLARITSGVVAFDYETTTLKPDGPQAEISCFAVCWNGSETASFPWSRPAAAQLLRVLTDPKIGKIGYNLDFEHRWTLAKTGREVRGWAWDGMLAAHCLDPRPGGKEKEDGQATGSGTTGLKFQAFVRLGMPEYNSHLEDHLRPKEQGGNARNRVTELPFRMIGKYCGLDALLEYLVAEDQAEEMGAEIWP